MSEIWRNVLGYEGKYMVSNLGRVKSIDRLVEYSGGYTKHKPGKRMKPYLLRKGYLRVALSKNGKRKSFLVHRLVWEAFNGPIPEGMQVNHINEVKTDNRLENLNLMTNKENCNWGTKRARQSAYFTNGPTSKPVLQYDLNGILVKEWPSIAEAKRILGISAGNIYSVCQKKRKRAGGYVWAYKEREKVLHQLIEQLDDLFSEDYKE